MGGSARAKALHQSWLATAPHLVGRHQVQVAGIRGVKLHDVVHGLPIGHGQRAPAHYLHALVQADLWKERPASPSGAQDCRPRGQAAPGLGFPSPLLLRWSGVKANGAPRSSAPAPYSSRSLTQQHRHQELPSCLMPTWPPGGSVGCSFPNHSLGGCWVSWLIARLEFYF